MVFSELASVRSSVALSVRAGRVCIRRLMARSVLSINAGGPHVRCVQRIRFRWGLPVVYVVADLLAADQETSQASSII